ncbi:MAG TPA: ATP-binding protein, partial [Polyangiaceae bacterium]|nr:ATP-binding protein [Polyangiaceae bacterium]
FTPETGKVVVEVRMAEMGDGGSDGDALFELKESAAQFRVLDSGIGVPDAEKIKIFEAFYQVDGGSTRAAGGAGMGLSIVKRLVEAHRGTIEVLDNEPNGSIFVVTLPYQTNNAAPE